MEETVVSSVVEGKAPSLHLLGGKLTKPAGESITYFSHDRGEILTQLHIFTYEAKI